jgi:hypothetical protein
VIGPLPRFARLKALTLAVLLAACHEGDVPYDLQPELARMDARDAAMSDQGKATYRALYSDGGKLAAFLSNSTVRHYDALHGSQVEYLAADGRTALWYPGNAVPVTGQWKIKGSFDGPDMCFMYGQNTYNPVTQQGGGAWECGDASLYLIGMAEAVKGDVFGLSQGRVPFKLSSAQTTLGQLASRAGVAKPGPNKVNW